MSFLDFLNLNMNRLYVSEVQGLDAIYESYCLDLGDYRIDYLCTFGVDLCTN